MKLKNVIFISLTVVMAGCLTSDIDKKNKELVMWMSEKSDFIIDTTYSKIEVFRGDEWGKIVKLQYTPLEIERMFLGKPFKTVSPDSISLFMFSDIEPTWSVRQKDYNAELYEYSNCGNGFLWNCLISKESSEVWFETVYADHSGDGPKCFDK